MQTARSPDRSAVLRACLAYVALFAGSGLNQPFFPIWLSAHVLDDWQISVVLSTPMLLRIAVTPAIAVVADRSGDRRKVITLLAALVLATALALGQAGGFWLILLLYSLMTLMAQAIQPIVDASVLSLVRRGITRDYGRMRLWGSISFAVVSVIGGSILGVGGPAAVFWAFTGAVAVQVVALRFLPQPPLADPPAGEAAGEGGPARPKRRADLKLAGQPLLLGVFCVAALVLTSQTTFNAFGSIYLRSIGYSERSIGLLWALATTSEVVMFWAGPRISPWLGPFGLLTLAAGAALVRWTAMAFSPNLPVTMGLQMLHAATFSCSYLGLMRFVETQVTDRHGATAQSAFVTVLGLMTAGATLAVGPIYHRAGSGAFLAAALLPLVALVILAAIRGPLVAVERLALVQRRERHP